MSNEEKYELALQFQDQVYDYFAKEWGWNLTHYTSIENQYEHGENKQGIEIKHDQKFEQGSPNVFISVERFYGWKQDGEQAQPSGIMKEHNKRFYIIGGRHKFYIFPLNTLRSYYVNTQPYTISGFMSKGNGREKGFLLNEKQAHEMAFEVYESQTSIV